MVYDSLSELKRIQNKDNSQTFNPSTDSLEAVSEAVTNIADNLPRAEVPVDITAILASETSFLDLETAGLHYTVDDLVLKSDDPGVGNVVLVQLYKLVNGFLTVVASFMITTAGANPYTNYYGLMEMFNKAIIAGDQIKITVQQQVAGGPTAVTGSYAYRSA
jgi:hypothetical protein